MIKKILPETRPSRIVDKAFSSGYERQQKNLGNLEYPATKTCIKVKSITFFFCLKELRNGID